MWCSGCGISGDKAILLDVISPKGIVKLCEKCSKDEDMPVLRKPTAFQLQEAEKKPRFPERVLEREKKKEELKKEEISLKEIANKNFEETISLEKKPRPDLVDNFHWIIMRKRRMKKITQEQFAKEIGEPEAAIKLAEQGILPEANYHLLRKIENFLGIRITKEEVPQIPEEQPAKEIRFDSDTTHHLTIADLKRMKEEKEARILGLEEKSEEKE